MSKLCFESYEAFGKNKKYFKAEKNSIKHDTGVVFKRQSSCVIEVTYKVPTEGLLWMRPLGNVSQASSTSYML